MATMRDHPYSQFNFLVDLGTGDPTAVDAGFAECSAIDFGVDVIEYRNGNDKDNAVSKLPGLRKVGDVTLRRGLIGSLTLYEWLNQVADGDRDVRTVRIQLQSEDHSEVVMTWTLLRARIVKYVTGPLNAKGSDVAMEELTLAYERLEME